MLVRDSANVNNERIWNILLRKLVIVMKNIDALLVIENLSLPNLINITNEEYR